MTPFSPILPTGTAPAADPAEKSALRAVRNRACEAGNPPGGVETSGTPGASQGILERFSPGASKSPPDTAMLRRLLRDMEAAWLADLSVAPHDDTAVALLQSMTLTWQSAASLLDGLDPRFLAALLLRGVSRLWTCGPATRPQAA